MRPAQLKPLPPIPVRGIRAVLFIAALTCIAATGSAARAALVLNFQQVGSDVVATGSGTLNTSALTDVGLNGSGAVIWASEPGGGGAETPQTGTGLAMLGPSTATANDVIGYYGITGPTSFGSGSYLVASSGTGDLVGVLSNVVIYVPTGYVSGSALSDTSTWSNSTFNSLGLTPGTYTWTWGSGATADSLTMTVPEPASIALLGITAAMALLRRRGKNA
jgi:hypothetical protein